MLVGGEGVDEEGVDEEDVDEEDEAGLIENEFTKFLPIVLPRPNANPSFMSCLKDCLGDSAVFVGV